MALGFRADSVAVSGTSVELYRENLNGLSKVAVYASPASGTLDSLGVFLGPAGGTDDPWVAIDASVFDSLSAPKRLVIDGPVDGLRITGTAGSLAVIKLAISDEEED